MEKEFRKTEYAEVSNSLRHLNDIRLKMVQFCITVNGFCLAFFATVSTSGDGGFWDRFSRGENGGTNAGQNIISEPSVIVAILAVFVTLLSLYVEVTSSKQFGILSERGSALESEFGVEGQYHLSLESLNARSGFSVMTTGILFYLAIVAFWSFLTLG